MQDSYLDLKFLSKLFLKNVSNYFKRKKITNEFNLINIVN